MANRKDICLIDELRNQHGKKVLIGVRSSFFFIGPSEEAIAEIRLIGIMAKACIQLFTNRSVSNKIIKKSPTDIGSRNVIKTYIRNPNDKGDEVVILIEGREFGAFWTRAEYLACREILLKTLEQVK